MTDEPRRPPPWLDGPPPWQCLLCGGPFGPDDGAGIRFDPANGRYCPQCVVARQKARRLGERLGLDVEPEVPGTMTVIKPGEVTTITDSGAVVERLPTAVVWGGPGQPPPWLVPHLPPEPEATHDDD